LNPSSADIYGLLGSALSAVGEDNGARDAFVRTTQLAPDNAIVQHNFGAFLKKNGELNEAMERFSRAISIDPNMQSALANLALTHFELGNIEECVESYKRLSTLPGMDVGTHYAFGNALMAAGYATEAIQKYEQAIDLDPEYAKAHWGIAMAHLRPIYDDVQEIEESRLAFANAIAELEAWFIPTRVKQGASAAVGSVQPFYLAYQAHDNRLLLETYGRLCSRLMNQSGATIASCMSLPLPTLRKLRVGFASAHVHDHSVWNAITKGWITHIDPSRFEVHVFHLGRAVDGETLHARRETMDFVESRNSLEDWMQTILDAKLDALIYPDIGMHPMTTQLAVQRLAPVQAASWGHPDTTGLPTIDLFLSAELLEPPSGDVHYSEKLIRLPNLGVCVDPLTPVIVAPELLALGLPGNETLLLCPGQLFKYSPEHDEVWVNLGTRLKTMGKGRLVFFRSPRAEISRQFEQRLRRAFARGGADFDATVCLIPTLPRTQFYGLMAYSTVMLDTIGFSGFNTALQSLECALPIVAHEGEFMRGRLASGLLRRIGLDEWIARSNAEFIEKTMILEGNPQLRLSVVEKIKDRRAILFNDLAPVRALERVLADEVAARGG
jgi:protein O-GlcNAc transferase